MIQTPDQVDKCRPNTCYLPKTAQDKRLAFIPAARNEEQLGQVQGSFLKALIP